VIFLPYLSGERTPFNNPYACGVFFGMKSTTESWELTQAVLEGVGFSIALGQAAIEAANVNMNQVVVIGGGAKSLYWGKILASILNRPLCYQKERSGEAAVGAARLAWLGIDGKINQLPKLNIETTVEPDNIDYYAKKLDFFKRLYKNIEKLFYTSVSF